MNLLKYLNGMSYTVLSSLKPGPLSYKLALIHTSENPKSEKRDEKIDAKMTRRVIDLIELSDSDEEKETDDEIEVIRDCKQTPEKAFDLINPHKIKKANGNQEESSDKNMYLVESARETMKMKAFSAVTWTVICSSRLRPKKKPLNNVNQSTLPERIFDKKKSCSCTNPQNYFSSPIKPFAQYSEKEISSFSGQLSKTSFEDKDKEILKTCDDEVIILSD